MGASLTSNPFRAPLRQANNNPIHIPPQSHKSWAGVHRAASRAFGRRRNRLLLGSVRNRPADASMFPPDFIARAAALVARYKAAGLMVATAESCTGGRG